MIEDDPDALLDSVWKHRAEELQVVLAKSGPALQRTLTALTVIKQLLDALAIANVKVSTADRDLNAALCCFKLFTLVALGMGMSEESVQLTYADMTADGIAVPPQVIEVLALWRAELVKQHV